MPNSRYFIVQKDDGWVIQFAGDDFGPYQTRREAMLFAVDAAQKLGEKGKTRKFVCLAKMVISCRNGLSGAIPIRPGFRCA